MNGLDLADRVLEIDRDLPVIFMSGTAADVDRGYGCVAKPFQGSELIAIIGTALQRPTA
jgi:FixJ family two-component response regulator